MRHISVWCASKIQWEPYKYRHQYCHDMQLDTVHTEYKHGDDDYRDGDDVKQPTELREWLIWCPVYYVIYTAAVPVLQLLALSINEYFIMLHRVVHACRLFMKTSWCVHTMPSCLSTMYHGSHIVSKNATSISNSTQYDATKKVCCFLFTESNSIGLPKHFINLSFKPILQYHIHATTSRQRRQSVMMTCDVIQISLCINVLCCFPLHTSADVLLSSWQDQLLSLPMLQTVIFIMIRRLSWMLCRVLWYQLTYNATANSFYNMLMWHCIIRYLCCILS